jgi:RND family efflux transporter MFP subunit
MKNYTVYLLIFIGSVFMPGCRGSSKDPGEAAPKVVLAVKAALIDGGTVDETVSATGRTAVTSEQVIVSPVAGTIVSMNVQGGTLVSRGEKIGVIRTRDSEASIFGARRLLAEARTESQREAAKQALEIAQANQQLIPLIAPRKGTVADRFVSAGQTVTEGTELLRLVDLSTLDFIADVPLKDMVSVKVGQACQVRFPSLPGSLFSGTVDAIEPQSDINSQTVPVRINFRRSPQEVEKILRVEMRGTARIITAQRKGALMVPQSAVIRDDIAGTHYIFTISPDSLAILVPVSIGVRTDSLIEIINPHLRAGMSVIMDGNYEAADSMRVTASMVAQP